MKEILFNGTFITMDEAYRDVEAVLIENGMISAVGSRQDMVYMAPDAATRDMNGHTVLPGFVDGHSHLTAVAYQQLIVNLNPPPAGTSSTIEDVVNKLKAALGHMRPGPGQWLMGMGYDNTVFAGGKHPSKEDLDQVSTVIPIVAIHVSGHLCVVNSRGMELMGYTKEPYDVPAGGTVQPSGLLKEQAFLASDKITGPSAQETIEAVGKAAMLYASYGFTTVQDAKVKMSEYGLLKAAGENGLLPVDVAIYVDPQAAGQLIPKQNPRENIYENHLRVCGLKLFLDGSPQGKTAWLSKPYEIPPEGETPDYRGFPVQKEEDVLKIMIESINHHWQINVHANGDEAIEQLIRCYSKALKETGSQEVLRPVIIHCQTVREDQLKRMKQVGMLASFFLDHVYYWGDYHYESVLGPERAERISPLKSAMEHGISFTLHQDSPVILPNVMFTVHNAVNRRTSRGRILGNAQRISVEEALKAVTINGACQIFEEDKKGSITPGKLADFVVLDRNPLKTGQEELKDIKVLETIKEGVSIYLN